VMRRRHRDLCADARGAVVIIRRSLDGILDAGYLVAARRIEFPTTAATGMPLVLRPNKPRFGPEGELPRARGQSRWTDLASTGG